LSSAHSRNAPVFMSISGPTQTNWRASSNDRIRRSYCATDPDSRSRNSSERRTCIRRLSISASPGIGANRSCARSYISGKGPHNNSFYVANRNRMAPTDLSSSLESYLCWLLHLGPSDSYCDFVCLPFQDQVATSSRYNLPSSNCFQPTARTCSHCAASGDNTEHRLASRRRHSGSTEQAHCSGESTSQTPQCTARTFCKLFNCRTDTVLFDVGRKEPRHRQVRCCRARVQGNIEL
jgi:hypothetical protein